MANFSTHLTGAAASAGLLSTLFLKAELVTASEALVLTLAGTVGGILPDIDLKYSYPSKILFTLIGTLAALMWMFTSTLNLAIVELWLLGLGLFLLVRYPFWGLFHHFTVHRGSVHSVVAAVMFAFLTAACTHRIFNLDSVMAWLAALFVFLGFLFHLLLDELYSVDFLGHRIKKSFGSAMKLFDFDRIGATVLMLFITLVSWFYTPSPQVLLERFSSSESRTMLFRNLLPDYITHRFKIPQVGRQD